MSHKAQRPSRIRHLFIDTHKLNSTQREKLVKRLQRYLGIRYFTGVDTPGDGTATISLGPERDGPEVVEGLVGSLIARVYEPRLLLDEEIGRLRTLHDDLPPPDVYQEMARQEAERGTTGSRPLSLSLPPADAVDVYPLSGDGLSGNEFNPETGEPPFMEQEELDQQVADYYPDHQAQAKAFICALDELLRRYVRLFVHETGARWWKRLYLGDAALEAFHCFRRAIKDTLRHSRRAD